MMNQFRTVGGPPILPLQQDDGDERTPLIRQTNALIGETSNVEQETRPRPIKPRYTAEQIHKMFKDDFSKHTRGHIAGDAFRATANQIASITKNVGTAALTAATLPWLLEKILPKDSEAYFYSALFLSHYFTNGALAGANELGRQVGKATNALMERALIRQWVRSSYKEHNKMLDGIYDYAFGGWRPTLPRRAVMMAKAMRERNNDSEFEYDELQAGLAIVDKAIDKYLENGKPGDVDAFDNFFHHLKAWELMARAPLPHEVSNLHHIGKNGEAEFDTAQAEIEAMVPATIRNELSSFMTVWRLSTLPGVPPSKDFIALVGDTELPDGTDLAEELCKKLTKKDPVIVSADHLNEFIDVVVAKDAVPRVKQKTACPKEALGPFLKWIESGNSACPIVIKEFDFKNSKHVRLIENLRKNKEINIYYDEIKGAKFTVNTQRTRFILCAREPSHGPEMPHLVAHAVIGSPSKEDRYKVLDLALKKGRGILDEFRLTEKQKDDIEKLIGQGRHASHIIEKSMKHKLSYPLMRELINKILAGISLVYYGIGELKGVADIQQEQPASAQEEAGPSFPGGAREEFAKEEFDKALEKFIKERFKAFPKKAEGKDKKDAKGRKLAEKPFEEMDVQAPTTGSGSSSLSRAYDILCARGLA